MLEFKHPIRRRGLLMIFSFCHRIFVRWKKTNRLYFWDTVWKSFFLAGRTRTRIFVSIRTPQILAFSGTGWHRGCSACPLQTISVVRIRDQSRYEDSFQIFLCQDTTTCLSSVCRAPWFYPSVCHSFPRVPNHRWFLRSAGTKRP